MAWDGNSNTAASRNYMYGDTVFILDQLTVANTAYLLGDLMAFATNIANTGKILNVVLNSPGGDYDVFVSLQGAFNLAKLNRIIVNTFVLGSAGSAASLLALEGNNRFMNKLSNHFIHFGCITSYTTKQSEIEKLYIQNKEYAAIVKNLYLTSSNKTLTEKKLLELQEDERGYLNAEQCLEYGLCDIIIENDLAEMLNHDALHAEFEDTYPTFLKNRKQTKPNRGNKK